MFLNIFLVLPAAVAANATSLTPVEYITTNYATIKYIVDKLTDTGNVCLGSGDTNLCNSHAKTLIDAISFVPMLTSMYGCQRHLWKPTYLSTITNRNESLAWHLHRNWTKLQLLCNHQVTLSKLASEATTPAAPAAPTPTAASISEIAQKIAQMSADAVKVELMSEVDSVKGSFDAQFA